MVPSTVLLFLVPFIRLRLSSGAFIDVLPRVAYEQAGHVSIGSIGRHYRYDPVTMCSDSIFTHGVWEESIAHSWAVDQVNAREDILPNITLGYVHLGDCGYDIPGVARALQFANLLPEGGGNQLSFGTQYDVVGVVGPTTSPAAVVSATIYGFFQMPQITASANADDLSDTDKYPYFFRLTGPVNHFVQAMAAMMAEMGWTYFSVIYYQDNFGYDGLRDVDHWASEYGLCIATSIGLGPFLHDWSQVIADLRKAQARVVVLLMYPGEYRWLSQGLEMHGAVGEFLFMLTDCVSAALIPILVKNKMPDSVWVTPYTVADQEFWDYITNLHPDMVPNEPWIREMWVAWFDCSWEVNDTEPNSCSHYDRVGEFEEFLVGDMTYRRIDAVFMFAAAIHEAVKHHCPEAFLDPNLVKGCVTPALVAEYLYQVVVDRPSGPISFSSTGESFGPLSLRQVRPRNEDGTIVDLVEVAQFDVVNRTISWSEGEELLWPDIRMSDYEMTLGHPESICSHACGPDQIYLQGELICCWECYTCRENEIVVENATVCQSCPLLMWPSKDTNQCEQIEYSYLSWSHPYGISLLILAALGLILVAGVCFIWIQYKQRRVIKGSSRELVSLILAGAIAGFLTVPTFIAKPTQVICALTRVGFNLTLALLFAPLLVKTNRIYRIFRASSRLQTELICIGSHSQLFLAGILVMVEIILTIVTSIIWIPEAEPRMPVPTTKYVELACSWDELTMLIPLSYNLFLLLICALYGFLTRKLPDNFNESWYIFISVSTTSFLWLAFLPTYYSAFYAFHKSVLLACAIILNVTVVAICLFVPKIYALWFIEESTIKVSNFDQRSFEHSTKSTDLRDHKSRQGTENLGFEDDAPQDASGKGGKFPDSDVPTGIET